MDSHLAPAHYPTQVQGELTKLVRRTSMNLITMETHSRDIVLSMIEDGFDVVDCFKWVGQLKTRFEVRPASPGNDGKAEDVLADICDATFQYISRILRSERMGAARPGPRTPGCKKSAPMGSQGNLRIQRFWKPPNPGILET